MNPRPRELEMLLLTAFAAAPLYATQAVGIAPLIAFHAALIAMMIRVATGRSPEVIPESLLRVVAMVYVVFYVIDAAVISRSAIAASTHLVLFIAVYQPIDGMRRENRGQRLLTAALIFVASIATATHITIVLFVIAFGFLMFRQMMYVSHVETARSIDREYVEAPSSRAATFYLVGSTVLAAFLFPVMPRVRNPLVHGLAGALNNATTGLSTTIDFNQDRTSTPDPTVVARVWMGQEAIPFFTPLRLRGAVYDRFRNNQWLQSRVPFRGVRDRGGMFPIAQPIGFARGAKIEQRFMQAQRLFVPTGTYAVSNIANLATGPLREELVTFLPASRTSITFNVSLARSVRPLRPENPAVMAYPVTPPVAALAQRMVANETDAMGKANAIESYLLHNYKYLRRP